MATKATPEAPFLLVFQRANAKGRITTVRQTFVAGEDAYAAAEAAHPHLRDGRVVPTLPQEVIDRTKRLGHIYYQGAYADPETATNRYAVVFRLRRPGEEED
jgi:hypothetical protein